MLWETHLRGPPRNVRDAPFGNGIDDVISAEALEAAETLQRYLRYYSTKASVN
jgi:hypothetical protein